MNLHKVGHLSDLLVQEFLIEMVIITSLNNQFS